MSKEDRSFDELGPRIHTGEQGRLLYRADLEDLLATPLPELKRLSATEHAEALAAAIETKQAAERLLAGEETGYFTDNQGNKIHIRTDSAVKEADLKVDRWIRKTDLNGSIIGTDLQVFEFSPEITILNSNPRDYNLLSNVPATPLPPIRREADQYDLRTLTSVLDTSTPRIG